VRQLVIKVLNIIEARCNHEAYVDSLPFIVINIRRFILSTIQETSLSKLWTNRITIHRYGKPLWIRQVRSSSGWGQCVPRNNKWSRCRQWTKHLEVTLPCPIRSRHSIHAYIASQTTEVLAVIY